MSRFGSAETPQKFLINNPTHTIQKILQKFQEVTNNPNITPVKGGLLTPYGFITKNQKHHLIFRLNFLSLTFNLPKIKIPLSRPPIARNLIFPESIQIVD